MNYLYSNGGQVIDPDTNIPMGRVSINQHDQGSKAFSYAFDTYELTGGDTEETIFNELYEFVDMVFNKEATALAYVKKLYRFFVKSEWDQEVEDTKSYQKKQWLKMKNQFKKLFGLDKDWEEMDKEIEEKEDETKEEK